MFETAEIGAGLEREAFKKEVPKLRTALLDIQTKLAGADFPVVVLISGVEGAGKSEFVNNLLEWMDARGIQVHAPWEPSDEERERPRFWRYWRMLPPKGKMGIFLGSWYTQPIVDRVFKKLDDSGFEIEMNRIRDLETFLADEGALLVKLWFHLSKKSQRKRLEKLEKDPESQWRVTKQDWQFFKKYDKFRRVSGDAIRETETDKAPWHIVEATDRRFALVNGARALLGAIEQRFKEARPKAPIKPDVPKPKKTNILNSLDYSRKLSDREYERSLAAHQGKLSVLSRRLREQGRSMTLVFEGPDAAGKGGTIRRLTQAMDARLYQVISIAAPTEEERAHNYLWRFWRALPRVGRVSIYDRSWYGRVLVERLEGFCAAEQWRRAFGEINQFEEQLTDFGTIVIKFWISITPDEQLRRFKDRQLKAYKQYKITEEDWRNREKWGAYEAAACDMIERTSTAQAPWVVVEGNDKRWSRLRVLQTVVERLEKELR